MAPAASGLLEGRPEAFGLLELVPKLPDHSKLALGFADRSLMDATRLARSLYADPSPLVLGRVGGGVNHPVWSKSMQATLGVPEATR